MKHISFLHTFPFDQGTIAGKMLSNMAKCPEQFQSWPSCSRWRTGRTISSPASCCETSPSAGVGNSGGVTRGLDRCPQKPMTLFLVLFKWKCALSNQAHTLPQWSHQMNWLQGSTHSQLWTSIVGQDHFTQLLQSVDTSPLLAL